MWQALSNMVRLVHPGGLLALALYNDQGRASRRWLSIKRTYNSGLIGRVAVVVLVGGYETGRQFASDLRHGRDPLARIRTYRSARGMSWWHDLIDWMGGLPFEVASVEAVEEYYSARGFALEYVNRCGGSGNNEFRLRYPAALATELDQNLTVDPSTVCG
jgi:hypothetical protein